MRRGEFIPSNAKMELHLILSYHLRYAFLPQDLTRQGYFGAKDGPKRIVQPQPGMRSVSRASVFAVTSLDIGSKVFCHQGSIVALPLRGMVVS